MVTTMYLCHQKNSLNADTATKPPCTVLLLFVFLWKIINQNANLIYGLFLLISKMIPGFLQE